MSTRFSSSITSTTDDSVAVVANGAVEILFFELNSEFAIVTAHHSWRLNRAWNTSTRGRCTALKRGGASVVGV
jgi:hypothetical protein